MIQKKHLLQLISMKLKGKRQAGEANKKAEEEQRKKAIEQKTLVTRRKAKTGETPLVKPELKKKFFC